MLSNDKSEEFYSRFHEQLLTSQAWPGKYMFKFIVRVGGVAPTELKKLFAQTDAKFSQKKSTKNTYTSFSVLVTMENPDAVIALYKQAQAFDGVITL